jgi:predicted acyltransferase
MNFKGNISWFGNMGMSDFGNDWMIEWLNVRQTPILIYSLVTNCYRLSTHLSSLTSDFWLLTYDFRPLKNETSHGINLRFASAYLFEVTRVLGLGGKWKKAHNFKILFTVWAFFHFPFPPPSSLSARRMKTITLAQRSSLLFEIFKHLR